MQQFIRIHPADTAAVALVPLAGGTIIKTDDDVFSLTEDLPRGHKFALADIPSGAPVIKYGEPIGYASKPIRKGDWIHTHNLRTGLGNILNYDWNPSPALLPPTQERSFQGFRRNDRKSGSAMKSGFFPQSAASTALLRQ